MLRRAVLLLVLCAAAGVVTFGMPEQELDVAYDAENRTLSGTLTTSATTDRGTAYFLLLPNLGRERNPHLAPRAVDEIYPRGFDESALDIDAVALADGETRRTASFRLLSMPPGLQTYSLADTILAVDGIQTSSRIEIRFTTHAPRVAVGDEGLTDDTFTWRFGWYPLCVEPSAELREADGVLYAGPTDAFPLVFPSAHVRARLTVPADMVVSAGADHVEREAAGADEDAPVAYTIWNDGPTRSLAVSFAPGLERYALDGPTPIEVTYRKGHANIARVLATYAREILADLASRYGNYPRARLALVENPNRDGDAFSADGLALLSTRYFTHRDVLLPGVLHRLTEFVLAHEIAHQWFGMGAGIDLDRDAWLSEGLAQYASVGYFERTYGAADPNLFIVTGKGLAEDFISRQFGYFNLREHLIELPYLRDVWSGFDEALVKPSIDVQYRNENVVRLYDKGFVVARALAAAVGEEAFDRALARSLIVAPGGRLNPETLERLVEEESGRRFDEWFAAWVYGNATVDYSVRVVSRDLVDATHETTVRVRRDGGVPQPVEIEARLVSGATARETWDGVEAESVIVFRTPSPVTRVTVDPEHRLPDRDRINNHAPVRIAVAADENLFPLDAYVLAPDPGSSGISFSRLDRFRVSMSQDEASLVVRRGRGEEFAAAAKLADGELLGSFSYSLTTYTEIETGAVGKTWAPGFAFLAAARREVSDGEPLHVLRLAAVRASSPVDTATAGVALDLAATGAARVAVAASDELGLLPQAYAQASAFLGFGFGDLPTALRFSFDELRAVPLTAADVKLSGTLALELPSAGELPYSLLHVAMIDEVRTRLFITGAAGWTTEGQFGTTFAAAEAGMEQVFRLSTLGGLLPFAVRLGVAVPLQGEFRPALYVDVSL